MLNRSCALNRANTVYIEKVLFSLSHSIYVHVCISQNFAHFSTDVERKAEELPYHLLQIGDKESLKACLLEKAMFNHLYDNEETRNQLLSYWRYLGGYELAANEYTAALEKQLEVRTTFLFHWLFCLSFYGFFKLFFYMLYNW